MVAEGADGQGGADAVACDPIQLAIFSHRFMGIAEQMGRTLQRTSISVSVQQQPCVWFGRESTTTWRPSRGRRGVKAKLAN